MVYQSARALLLVACGLVSLVGCAKSKVKVATSDHVPPTWKGAFLTAPEAWEKLGRSGYAEVRFGQSTRVQIAVRDKKFDRLLWIAKAAVTESGVHSVVIKCESVMVFDRSGETHRQIFSRRANGEETKLPALTKDLESELSRFEKESEILRGAIPESWRLCSGGSAALERKIEKNELRLTGGSETTRFAAPQADSYRTAVDGITRPIGKLEVWSAATEMKLSSDSVILEDSRNRTLPLTQTFRYFVMPKLDLANDTTFDEGGEFALRWKRGTRPSLLNEKRKLPVPVRESIDTSRWETPTATNVAVTSVDDASLATFDLTGKSPEKTPILKLGSDELTNVLCREKGKYRVVVSYTSPSLKADGKEIRQIVEVEVEAGKITKAGTMTWEIAKP